MRDPARADRLRLSITVGAIAALALGAIAAGLAVEGGPVRTRMTEQGVQLLRDPTGALTFDHVLALRGRGAFALMDPRHTNFAYTRDVFWLLMEVRAPGSGVIELTTTPDRAVLYAVDPDGRLQPPQESGTALPFEARPIVAANVAFPVTVPAGGALTVYLQVRSGDTMILDPLLWSRAAFEAKERNCRLLDGGVLRRAARHRALQPVSVLRHRRSHVRGLRDLRALARRLPGDL